VANYITTAGLAAGAPGMASLASGGLWMLINLL